jgi:hypothetical protein
MDTSGFALETTEQLAKRANALVAKGDQAQTKSIDFYISAGLAIAEAKNRVTAAEESWGDWCRENLTFGPTKRNHCLKLAGKGWEQGVDWEAAAREHEAEKERKAAAERTRRATAKSNAHVTSSPRGEQVKHTVDSPVFMFFLEHRAEIESLSKKDQKEIVNFIKRKLK